MSEKEKQGQKPELIKSTITFESASTEVIYKNMKRKPTTIPRFDLKLAGVNRPKGDK